MSERLRALRDAEGSGPLDQISHDADVDGPDAPRAGSVVADPADGPTKLPRQGNTAIVVMGVAGCGKTTVAAQLAARLGYVFAEADDFHPASNVAKMSAGTPLTDEDRWPWLIAIRTWLDTHPGDAVLTCSALRRRYRDLLSEAGARVRFVHLDGSVEQLRARLSARIGHFMPASLLTSQLETLERLEPDEDGVVIDIDATPETIVDRVIRALGIA